MATTFGQLVDEVRANLAGWVRDQEQSTYLTADITSADLTLPVNDASVLSRGTLEIGDELLWVERKDDAAQTATVPPYGRGWQGTTAAAHTSGERVLYNPIWPRSVIKREINAALGAVYPDLFGVAQTTFAFSAAVSTYELPAEAQDILSVTWQTVGPSQFWAPVPRWDTDRDAATAAFASGKSITLSRAPVVPGRSVKVVYTKSPSLLVDDSDLFTSTGLNESARDVIMLGTCARLTAYADAFRTTDWKSVEADMLDQPNPVGSGQNISKYLYALYKQRLGEERRNLLAQHPRTVRFTR